jgi:hypothetical protein
VLVTTQAPAGAKNHRPGSVTDDQRKSLTVSHHITEFAAEPIYVSEHEAYQLRMVIRSH